MKWKINVSELEALLSLWLFHFRKDRGKSDSPGKEQRTRILGPNTSALKRDLRWWMIDEFNRGINYEGGRFGDLDDMAMGFCGIQDQADDELQYPDKLSAEGNRGLKDRLSTSNSKAPTQ
ncbi:Protein of unknown function [Pyronema omphalodes CBS 100304]|uniref:Uncharacterized protein n=1 Tax=Pyronema omphalodes (strain CBS 100304) TaxID=1076935 RepID=U4LVY9_PYROM|nr:Protein of unknown function [Pyronema omphalodes CBS 100304]